MDTDSEIVYKCTDYYAPETEGAVLWNDPTIGIDWPSDACTISSDKDTAASLLADLKSPFICGESLEGFGYRGDQAVSDLLALDLR